MIVMGRDLNEFKLFLQGCGLSDNSIRAYIADCKKFLDYAESLDKLNKEVDLTSFNKLCEEYITSIREDNKSKNSSKNRTYSTIRKFIEYISTKDNSIRKYHYEFNNIHYIRKFHHNILSIREINLLLSYFDEKIKNSKTIKSIIKNKRNKFIFTIILHTGIRPAELVEIKWEDINFELNTININHGVNNSNRTIQIDNKLIDELLKYKLDYTTLYNCDKKYSYLIPGYTPFDKLTTKTIRHISQDINKANIISKEISPISLRHTMVYWALRNNVDLLKLSQDLGHKHLNSTEELYEKLLKDLKIR
ncbi:tyrosine-type recombinase/integrase [Clostridium perfringens]|uniref:tyrosine-type recombinase/integrase n=1 Tax=Clostridium perfringens TaxID=1502 RepID=UPI003D327D29